MIITSWIVVVSVTLPGVTTIVLPSLLTVLTTAAAVPSPVLAPLTARMVGANSSVVSVIGCGDGIEAVDSLEVATLTKFTIVHKYLRSPLLAPLSACSNHSASSGGSLRFRVPPTARLRVLRPHTHC